MSAPLSPSQSNGGHGTRANGAGGNNGAGGTGDQGTPARRTPWEFRALIALVALMAIGIVLAWTFIGSKSPERLDLTATSQLSAACTDAQAQLEALPNRFPLAGADRVTRIRAENDVLRTMIDRFAAVRPIDRTPADALRGWSTDWTNVVEAREQYSTKLEATRGTDEKVQVVLPASRGMKPVTRNMDDFVRENHPHLMACFTERLALETVEGQREYRDVTE